MEELQSWWEVPTIAHFCYVFRTSFNLFHFEIEELEAALLEEGEVDDFASVEQLITRLLVGCSETEDISYDWEDHLKKLLQLKWTKEKGRRNPLSNPDNTSFSSLPLRTKVEILLALCNYRLDAEDVADVLKNTDGDTLRIEPVGCDSERNVYWYFFGVRLYKESRTRKLNSKRGKNEIQKDAKIFKQNKKKLREEKTRNKQRNCDRLNKNSNTKSSGGKCNTQEKPSWSVACYTIEDWEDLVRTLRKSRFASDKKLCTTLESKFLPCLPRIIAEKERNLRKRIMELAPRRASARIGKVRRQKEEEERLASETAEQKRIMKAEEEEKRLLVEEKERKKREIVERAKRAEERWKAVEARAKRARLREFRYCKGEYYDEYDSQDTNENSVTSEESRHKDYDNMSTKDEDADDSEGSEEEECEEEECEEEECEEEECEEEEYEEEEIEEEESEDDDEEESEEDAKKNSTKTAFSAKTYCRQHQSDTNKSQKYDENAEINEISVENLSSSSEDDEAHGSSYNKKPKFSSDQGNVNGAHKGFKVVPSSNWKFIKMTSPCDKRYKEDVAELSVYERKINQSFYLKREQNVTTVGKFDFLNGANKSIHNSVK